MNKRRHAWPEGHWGWPIPVTHKHGLRCGEMIFFGGQVDLDSEGRVRNPNDLTAQTRAAMHYIERVLAELDADPADLVKLFCFYVQRDPGDPAHLLAEIASDLGSGPGPVVRGPNPGARGMGPAAQGPWYCNHSTDFPCCLSVGVQGSQELFKALCKTHTRTRTQGVRG